MYPTTQARRVRDAETQVARAKAELLAARRSLERDNQNRSRRSSIHDQRKTQAIAFHKARQRGVQEQGAVAFERVAHRRSQEWEREQARLAKEERVNAVRTLRRQTSQEFADARAAAVELVTKRRAEAKADKARVTAESAARAQVWLTWLLAPTHTVCVPKGMWGVTGRHAGT